MVKEATGEDAELRAGASPNDPKDTEIFEQTRNGLAGWIDDELAVLKPWGFDPAEIEAPAAVWYNPGDVVLPPQHAQWLAQAIPDAMLIATTTLGHGAEGDPYQDHCRLYSWFAGRD